MLRPLSHSTAIGVAMIVLGGVARAQQPSRIADMPRTVTLPLAEYNRLLDLSTRPRGDAPAPVASVLATADLRVRVDRETARGTIALAGEVLRPGVSRVDLTAGATLTEASAAGRPLPLVADGAAHAALVPGPGPFLLSLEWGTPLTYSPGRASFTLPVPRAGAARATIDLPGDQADVRLSAGLVTRRSVAGGRTIVEATLDPGSATEVQWSMRDSAPAAAAREVRALADVLTLVTIGDADVRMAALVDVTVVQGELRSVDARVPAGYEVTSVSGSTLESSDVRDGAVTLRIGDAAARRHQFMIGLERPHDAGSFRIDTAVVAVPDLQRERGEIAVEGVGTIDLTATERDGMHRLDVRELNPSLHALARLPILAAFRYQRTAATPTGLTLDVTRFADSGVLAAVADRAVATTLVTSEGRALTEIALTVQNRAQPFLKVVLPSGASIVSVDVEGEPAKPAIAADGARVPLLRPGFRPTGPYHVTFVYLQGGTPFAKKGETQMVLPRMDIPVALVEWQLFVPDTYSVRTVGGNVIDRQSMPRIGSLAAPAAAAGVPGPVYIAIDPNGPAGQIRGRAKDATGAVIPGVTVTVDTSAGQRTTITGSDGTFRLTNVATGSITVTASLAGFVSTQRSFLFDGASRQIEFMLAVGAVTESVSVAGMTPEGDRARSAHDEEQRVVPPPQNVLNLQQRTAGVLPVRVDVPRAGTSLEFVKPLLIDDEATVRVRYARR